MNIDVVKLEARAQTIRIWVAATRGAHPNPEGSVKMLLDMIYGLAEEVIAGVELLADVTAEVDRATKSPTKDDDPPPAA